MQLVDFFRQDGTPTATKNLDVAGTLFLQEVVHVFEVLNVPALVRGHGNGIGIFLNSSIYDLFDGAVVAEVNDLTTGTLNDATHDVNGRVVAVKQ